MKRTTQNLKVAEPTEPIAVRPRLCLNADAKKLLLHFLGNVATAIENGLLADPTDLGVVALKLKDIAHYLDLGDSTNFNYGYEGELESANLDAFLETVPDEWKTPWGEINAA